MATKLQKLFGILGDNEWHSLNHITGELDITESKFEQMVSLLKEADVIQHDQTSNQIRLNQGWNSFLVCPEEISSASGMIGTIIVSPQQSLIIQCTRITNLTDTSLELEVRGDKKLREIAINTIR